MLNPQEAPLKVGSHLGKYKILEELGEGPISHVFLADDTVLYRQVALKILKPEFAREPAGELPEEEMNSAAVLLHSGIVPLYGTGAGGGYHYFSMALMPGGNLRSAMQRGISPQQGLTVISQVARALAFAHAKGINHQAIKPENILFRKDGSAVLSDFHVVKVHGFGIGALAQEPEPHPHYLSPEQIQNLGKQFGRADLYSLGIVLYEMLTGDVPFKGENAPWQHIHSPVPKLPSSLSEYQGLIDQLLAKRPADRFVDVNQLIKTLDQLTSKKAPEKGGNITLFPGGGKARIEGTNGDRPFLEGQGLGGSPFPPAAAVLGGTPETSIEAIPSIPLDLPDFTPPPRASAPPVTSPLPRPEDLADHGSIGDLIREMPRKPAPPRPEPRPKENRNRRRREGRRKALMVGALLAVLAASGAVWFNKDELTGSLGSLISTTIPSSEPPPSREGSFVAPASTAQDALTVQFSQAVDYSRSGRSAEAIAIFMQIAQQFPHLPEPYNNLAVLYAAEGDLSGSQQLLEEALRVHPTYATILENLNVVQLEQALGGEYRGEKSAPRLQLLSQITPHSPTATPERSAGAPPPSRRAAAPAAATATSPSANSGASQEADATAGASALLQDWAKAWSAKDYPRYLAFYGKGFTPSGQQSRASWEKARFGNVTAPAWIQINMTEMHVSPSGSGRVRVVAVQEYRSDRYRDRTLKAFELGREGDSWVILSEENLGQLR